MDDLNRENDRFNYTVQALGPRSESTSAWYAIRRYQSNLGAVVELPQSSRLSYK